MRTARLSTDEEHAAFLSIRAMCLRDNGRILEAALAFEAAAKLNPNCRSYRQMARRLLNQETTANQKEIVL